MSVFSSFFGMWIMNKLPQVWHPFFRSDRFARVTDDAFVLGIEAKDKRFDREATKKLLKDAGAIEIEDVYLEGDPARKNMPKWIYAFIIASTAFALIPFAIAAKARSSHSKEPHIHIFPDMDFQPKYKSDQAMDMFEDGRENRGQIQDTVARGQLNGDDIYYRGLENGEWTMNFPKQIEVNDFLIKRGQQRFNIYCTPCHGFDGHGNGTVPQRVEASGAPKWTAADLTKPGGNPMQMPNGQLFNTISNGANTMPGYAAQIPVADRWAILLYVRALQRSQNAPETDVGAANRDSIR
jgi:mono/diheme cytochrome c family protein